MLDIWDTSPVFWGIFCLFLKLMLLW